jgi:predicted  nucleic acid-binding Zn-ribbon protein
MEQLEIKIVKLKDTINKHKSKIQAINYKINNETSEYIIEALEKSLKTSKVELQNYLTELKKLEDEYKKEILEYKKSLNKLKESLTEFYRDCKSSTKLRKHINDMSNSIIQMERILGN